MVIRDPNHVDGGTAFRPTDGFDYSDSPWVGQDEAVDREVVIAATREELVLIATSLNEALEAVEAGSLAQASEDLLTRLER